MFSTTDFRNGLKIEWEGSPYEIVEFQHFKPGKGGAIVRTKLRNLLTGGIVNNNFRSGEKVGRPDLETRVMQFLYRDGETYHFMDMTTYEQLELPAEQTSGKGLYLVDGQEVKVLLYRGNPLDMDIPTSAVLEVAQTDPGVKGDTVSGATKPATLSTGLVVNVPLFINEGDMVKVDTRSGDYLGRE